jgi:hypothetical protein
LFDEEEEYVPTAPVAKLTDDSESKRTKFIAEGAEKVEILAEDSEEEEEVEGSYGTENPVSQEVEEEDDVANDPVMRSMVAQLSEWKQASQVREFVKHVRESYKATQSGEQPFDLRIHGGAKVIRALSSMEALADFMCELKVLCDDCLDRNGQAAMALGTEERDQRIEVNSLIKLVLNLGKDKLLCHSQVQNSICGYLHQKISLLSFCFFKFHSGDQFETMSLLFAFHDRYNLHMSTHPAVSMALTLCTPCLQLWKAPLQPVEVNPKLFS